MYTWPSGAGCHCLDGLGPAESVCVSEDRPKLHAGLFLDIHVRICIFWYHMKGYNLRILCV